MDIMIDQLRDDDSHVQITSVFFQDDQVHSEE
jgi:hypothetical protein